MNSAPPTTIVNQAPPDATRPRLTVADVLAQWVQNAGGGVGVGLLVALAAYWLGYEGRDTARVALSAAGLAFGALMAFRAIVDEVLDWHAWAQAMADNEALAADLDSADADLEAAHARIDELVRENGQLLFRVENGRNPNFVAAQPAPSEPAGSDVRKLIEVAYAGGAPQHPGRRTMVKSWAWSEKRYDDAYAALRAAGVVTGPDNAPKWPATQAAALDLLA